MSEQKTALVKNQISHTHDPVWLIIRPCSTQDSTSFDYSVRSTVLICDESRTPFDSVGRIMSRTPRPRRFVCFLSDIVIKYFHRNSKPCEFKQGKSK